MMKMVHLAVAVLMFCGWVIYLAGVADSNSICNKVQKGDLLQSDLYSSVDSPDKNFLPLSDPWGTPIVFNQPIATARKLMSHGRELMGTGEDNCGWTYSFAWWTVALQGLATILALLVAVGALGFMSHSVGPLLYVNTALLCVIASALVPQAADFNATKTKGKFPDAVYTTAAGIIITLISNFFYFLAPKYENELGHGAANPEAK